MKKVLLERQRIWDIESNGIKIEVKLATITVGSGGST